MSIPFPAFGLNMIKYEQKFYFDKMHNYSLQRTTGLKFQPHTFLEMLRKEKVL